MNANCLVIVNFVKVWLKKMTDNEIIKALECCINIGERGCTDCPAYDTKIDDCVGIPWKSILDIINRLQAENDKLAKDWSDITIEKDELFDIAEKQKAEIERLNKEIDRLSQIILYHPGQMADAIKDFAERLKAKEAIHFCKCGEPFVYTDLFNGEIDNLVKEMVGDNNG